MTVGALIGTRPARDVEMAGMPGLIAMTLGFAGVAAVLVGENTYFEVAASLTTGYEHK